MGTDIDTAKVRRIAEEAVALHQAKCPAVKAVADALQDHKEETAKGLQGIRDDLRDQHEENLKAYHETEKTLLKGDAEFKEHDRRLDAVEAKATDAEGHGPRIEAAENVIRHLSNEMESHKKNVSTTKTKIIIGLLKVIVYLALGGAAASSILGSF